MKTTFKRIGSLRLFQVLFGKYLLNLNPGHSLCQDYVYKVLDVENCKQNTNTVKFRPQHVYVPNPGNFRLFQLFKQERPEYVKMHQWLASFQVFKCILPYAAVGCNLAFCCLELQFGEQDTTCEKYIEEEQIDRGLW